MIDIKSLTFQELKQELLDLGEKEYRAQQIYQWIHVKLVQDFDSMNNLSKALRDKLKSRFFLYVPKIERMQESSQDGTRKYLFELADGNMIESVFMRYKHGNSVCISSQAGCRMGCTFCASTIDGLARSLTASEMIEQIYSITRHVGERISNVVVMGSGEPMDNYENLLRFIKLLTDEFGLHMSQRNVTVSTCGIVPKIYDLAKEKLQITLAISLHASNDEKRRQLMPIAKKYPMSELLEACKFYFNETKRRISFEYSLVEGVNDSLEEAEELSRRIKDLGAHVNLIPVNPIEERDYVNPKMQAVQAFKNKLEKNKINVTIRREMGQDIDGACGQLRRSHAKETGGN